MNDRERRKAEVIEFVKNARPKENGAKEKVRISGDHNIVAGRDVNINRRQVVRTTIQPGPSHITPQQAVRLQDLIRKAADIDVVGGMTQRAAMSKWWSLLKRHYRVTTYREIPRHLGEEAITWLRQRIAMSRPKLRRTDNRSWRAEHCKAIYARAGELGLAKGEVYALVYERLGKRVTSLNQLGEQNLQKFYRIMLSIGRGPSAN